MVNSDGDMSEKYYLNNRVKKNVLNLDLLGKINFTLLNEY